MDDRQGHDIDNLWELFAQALHFSDSDDVDAHLNFITAYNTVSSQYGITLNITNGLYWIRPWSFQTLDTCFRDYIDNKLHIKIGTNGAKGFCSADEYLTLLDTLETRFQEDKYPVRSFPELSLTAWLSKGDITSLTPMEMETEFRTWALKQKNKKNKFYDPTNLNYTYIPALKRETEKIQGIENIHTNLFYYTNSKDFNEVAKKINAASNYNRINNQCSNGAYSAAMGLYVRFLIAREHDAGKYMLVIDEEHTVNFVSRDTDVTSPVPSSASYSIDEIINDGCFVEREKLKFMLKRLQTKKNIILQGPPGTGKTWLAKRLAFALIEEKNDSNVKAVQFHPNLAYEDFVRGWRPSGDGKLTLVDGPFMEIINTAKADKSTRYVVVIEEINRGNPAQIFGEMLTLLEVDKRTADNALELSYRKCDGERVYIPSNLYIIGTMNIADRSLALVDLALRRRFAFIDLKPTFGDVWRKWLCSKYKMNPELVRTIENKIQSLNQEISRDSCLGEQCCIGHSYVTPSSESDVENAHEWFRQVVETEIGPLLDEYWYDSSDTAKKAKEQLLEGF